MMDLRLTDSIFFAEFTYNIIETKPKYLKTERLNKGEIYEKGISNSYFINNNNDQWFI